MRLASRFLPLGLLALSFGFVQCASAEVGPRNNSRLALSVDGSLLVTTNTDSDSISVVDTAKRQKKAEIVVGDNPESAALLGDQGLVAVTVFREDRVVIADLAKSQIVQRITVPDEPYGVVSDKAGQFCYVTHDYPGLVTEIDVVKGKVVREINVGGNPRGIAIDAKDERLYIAHFHTGWISVVDRASGKVIDQWKGSASDNLARQVVLHPQWPTAYVPHLRSRVDREQGTGSISPFVTVVDLNPNASKRRIPQVMDTYNGVAVPADPSDVALSPDGKTHYVLYAGTDDMNVSNATEDYPYLTPRGGLRRLGSHPRGIAVHPRGHEIYVLNALDFNVWVIDAQSIRKLDEISVSENREAADVLLGQKLFHSANQPMSSRRWISCASCHPAGDQDQRVWFFPEGKRNSTGMFGMSHTLPLHWAGDRDELQDFEHTVRGPLMQGIGLLRGPLPDALGERITGRSQSLDALAAFCNSLKPTLSPHAAGNNRLSPQAERGKILFEMKETQCASCHPAPYYTDSSIAKKPFPTHDVGTSKGDPTEKLGPGYDTPSLIGVYRSAPYLHDGRAETLRDVLTTHNKEDRHGKTSHLNDGQIQDLIEFLKALPYLDESIDVKR